MVEDGPKRTEQRAGELVRIFPHPPPSLLARPCNIPLIYCFKPIPPSSPSEERLCEFTVEELKCAELTNGKTDARLFTLRTYHMHLVLD